MFNDTQLDSLATSGDVIAATISVLLFMIIAAAIVFAAICVAESFEPDDDAEDEG